MITQQAERTSEQTPDDLLASMPKEYRAAFVQLIQDTAQSLASENRDYPKPHPIVAPYPILAQPDQWWKWAWVVFAMLVQSGHLPVPDAGKRDSNESLAHTIAVIREAMLYCETGSTQ